MTNVKEKKTDFKVTKQLRSMLNNHDGRSKNLLNVFVLDKRKNVVEEASFEMFTFNPEEDIKKKITKMKKASCWETLKILDLKKVADAEYTVILSI